MGKLRNSYEPKGCDGKRHAQFGNHCDVPVPRTAGDARTTRDLAGVDSEAALVLTSGRGCHWRLVD